MKMKRIVLAGGSGFIGRALAKALLVRGYQVVVLTRSPRKDTGFWEVEWDGIHLGEWIHFLDGAGGDVSGGLPPSNAPRPRPNAGFAMRAECRRAGKLSI
jgi:uncharacterized protein YbjT (DUF2867 family)